ncbi:MAG: tRNA (adenosine(37)-N6)-threonylcarbamoyltransferase complex transferase subunit TsaD [Bacteroidetes bacterium GWE2_29_8]|nr:MAG: tRNA (adenosine(37)-N6)-threonylcarbamoyltransferase complex transferase subunit TsaD [Bacteroidetes bacterium GWE2_29_8]OFY21748.1 MAG: tRNA (adenosine(37)-N6)-threonylcarbamoyltransferase complex transferase subunit TsaD [Bacteroidetes bacterium GWF2_29_10]
MKIKILAIESSCDDTSAAIVSDDGIILSNIIANQNVHIKYGGVVPELASRAHQQNIIPVVKFALEESKINKSDLNAIAYTRGPGLMGSLLVGTSFAKSLALALNIPIIEVNHLDAHIFANFIKEKISQKIPSFPFLCLTVSGGHTQISIVKSFSEIEIIGKTIDDAAGEAFDKTAKILGLPYPGGPLIDKYAKIGNPYAFKFAQPNIKDFDFSFSGLKTSILYFIKNKLNENREFVNNNLNDICASVQNSIVEILINKMILAIKHTGINQIALAGGVSANSGLREAFLTLNSTNPNIQTYIPKIQYCTDNAAMVAITAYYKYIDNKFGSQVDAPYSRQSTTNN